MFEQLQSDPKLKLQISRVVYKQFRDISFLNGFKQSNKKYEFIHWMVQSMHHFETDNAGTVIKSGTKFSEIFVITKGEVEYWHSKLREPYHTVGQGGVVGFTDFIYKMHKDVREPLIDGRQFFCDHAIRHFGKYKFTARAKGPLSAFYFDFRQNFDTWRKLHAEVTDKFFSHQLWQLRVTLYNRLSLVAHFLEIDFDAKYSS